MIKTYHFSCRKETPGPTERTTGGPRPLFPVILIQAFYKRRERRAISQFVSTVDRCWSHWIITTLITQ